MLKKFKKQNKGGAFRAFEKNTQAECVHINRVAGGDFDHRPTGWVTHASRSNGKRIRKKNPVFQPRQAIGYECSQF